MYFIFLLMSSLVSLFTAGSVVIVDKHFSDLLLREHLHLAVSSMVTRGNSLSLDHVRE